MIKNIRILLICDDASVLECVRDKLVVEGGCMFFHESTSMGGIDALKEDNFDVVIAKLGMPDLDTKELIKALKKTDPDCVIIIFSEKEDSPLLNEISDLGIYAFITDFLKLDRWLFLVIKGAQLHAALISNRRLIHILQEQNVSLQKQNTLLAKRIEESTRNLTRLYEDLRSTYMRTIKVLAKAIDARDHYTHSHSENVKRISIAISEEMGLSLKDIEIIGEACELHDLGKIGVEDSILSKTSSLNAEEWEHIKRHPELGAQILEPLTFLDGVIDLVRQHHEHYDGSGYPEGRRGEDILLGARIIHLADAYESMCTARSYRQQPLSKEEAVLEIKNNNGTQFDPQVVEAFLMIVDKL